MRSIRLFFLLIFILGTLHAQIKVKSNGQIEINGGSGISGQISPKFYFYSTSLSQGSSTALSLVNTNKNVNTSITLDFKSPNENNLEQSYTGLQTVIIDKSKPTSNFFIYTYSNGYFRKRIGIHGKTDNDYDATIHFNTGRAGATPEDRGIVISNHGDGEATLRPYGTGWGYIGTNTAYWRKLYVWYAYYNGHATITSDRRMKRDIQELNNGIMSKISQVKGVQYQIKNDELENEKSFLSKSIDTERGEDIAFLEKADAAIMAKRKRSLQREAEKTHFGFIAQELIEVFPQVVEYNEEEDSYGIQYTALIPVLFEGMKEQQKLIDAQNLKIDELEKKINQAEVSIPVIKTAVDLKQQKNISANTNAFLYQNVPNPFSNQTEIKYYVPEGVKNAALYIFNIQGKLLKTEKIKTVGSGSILINGSELIAGIYLYSLIIEGLEVDTKRMILTD